MARKSKTSKRAEDYTPRAIKSSRKALLNTIVEDMYQEYLENDNQLPYGHVTNLLDELKPREDWVTRSIINKAFIKYKAEMKKRLEGKTQQLSILQGFIVGESSLGQTSPSMLSELSNVSSTRSSNIGRSLGSTQVAKETKRQQVIDCKNEITEMFSDLKKDAKKKQNGRVEKGALNKIIEQVKKKRKGLRVKG